MLENLKGQIDEGMGSLLDLILPDLIQQLGTKKQVPNFVSMLLQTISICFWYNSALTFNILEQKNATVQVFQLWLGFMSKFKKDFELRRVIFGLTSILVTSPAQMPPIVSSRLADITVQLATLTLKSRQERIVVLEDNEKYIKENQDGEESNSDDDDEGDENGMMDQDKDSSDDEKEYLDTLKKLKAEKDKNEEKRKNGITDDDEAESDDDSDSDYEYAGGDLALYESVLDEVDEIKFVKENLDVIFNADQNYYLSLMSQVQQNQELNGKLMETMNGLEELMKKEEEVRIKCEEIEKKEKKAREE